MIRKIAFVNFKGGTGKTTSAVNIAHALALKKKKVLLIDADPQGSVATCLGIEPENTFFELLSGNLKYKECLVEARKNLDVIPSDRKLSLFEIQLAQRSDIEKAFKDSLKNIRGYDFIILDCPPSMSILNVNAIEYADEIIVPVSAEYLALKGVQHVVNNLPDDKELDKIIPTFVDRRTRKSSEILSDLKNYFKDKVLPPARINTKLSEAASFHKTIFEYAPSSRGAQDYKKIARRILKND